MYVYVCICVILYDVRVYVGVYMCVGVCGCIYVCRCMCVCCSDGVGTPSLGVRDDDEDDGDDDLSFHAKNK